MELNEVGRGMDRLILAPAGRRDAVVELIRGCQRELLLSMFRCDDLAIVDELASAVKRGVQVRVLITQRARGWKEKLKDLTALLRSFGADVRPYDAPEIKYHAKYIVSDDGPALVASLNFTRKCFEETCDFMVLSEDAHIISGLRALFKCDCAGGPEAPQMTDRLILGPEHSRRRLSELLSGANSSIHIIDHRVTDPQILALLAAKVDQGVSVCVLGNGPMGGLISHGRMILIDEKTAIIGSIHLSPPSLDSRREVAILIEEPSLVAELCEYFRSLATNSLNVMNLRDTGTAWSRDEDEEEDE
jgi:phosphatidylserine/phosphatidylglycerophosphate/cardiolipin synthase-like enzyme